MSASVLRRPVALSPSFELALAAFRDALSSTAAELRFTASFALLCLLPRLKHWCWGPVRMPSLRSAFSTCFLAVVDSLRDSNRYVIAYSFNCLGLLAAFVTSRPSDDEPSRRTPSSWSIVCWSSKVRASAFVSLLATANRSCSTRILGSLAKSEYPGELPSAVACNSTSLPDVGAGLLNACEIDSVLRIICASRRCPYSNSENRWCEGSRQTKGDSK
jgi:hypothetical protein